MLKRLVEFFTGWSEDKFCRTCGCPLKEWTQTSRADSQTGEALEVVTYKTCSCYTRHCWYEKYQKVVHE